jgi:hypothetical protein
MFQAQFYIQKALKTPFFVSKSAENRRLVPFPAAFPAAADLLGAFFAPSAPEIHKKRVISASFGPQNTPKYRKWAPKHRKFDPKHRKSARKPRNCAPKPRNCAQKPRKSAAFAPFAVGCGR